MGLTDRCCVGSGELRRSSIAAADRTEHFAEREIQRAGDARVRFAVGAVDPASVFVRRMIVMMAVQPFRRMPDRMREPDLLREQQQADASELQKPAHQDAVSEHWR